jgi:hypothetical protein
LQREERRERAHARREQLGARRLAPAVARAAANRRLGLAAATAAAKPAAAAPGGGLVRGALAERRELARLGEQPRVRGDILPIRERGGACVRVAERTRASRGGDSAVTRR